MISIQTSIVENHSWKIEGTILTIDGSKWMAVIEDFINPHVSPAGFSESQEQAVLALKEAAKVK